MSRTALHTHLLNWPIKSY